MTTKTAILTFALLLLMAAGVVVGIYLVRQNQDVRSRADETTITDPNPTQAPAGAGAQPAQQGAQSDACTPPAEVTNVAVDYPSCD